MVTAVVALAIGLFCSRSSVSILRKPRSVTPVARWWRAVTSVSFWLVLAIWFALLPWLTTVAAETALCLLLFATPAVAFALACVHARRERAAEATRRAAHGLPPRRPLVTAWQIGVSWVIAYLAAELTVLYVQAFRRHGAVLDLRPMFAVVAVTVGLGVLHTSTQLYRLKAENARSTALDAAAAPTSRPARKRRANRR